MPQDIPWSLRLRRFFSKMVSIYLRFPLVLWQVFKKEIWITSLKEITLHLGMEV